MCINSLEEIFPVVLHEAAQEFKEWTLDFRWGVVWHDGVNVVHAQGDGVGDELFEWLARLTHYQLQQFEEPVKNGWV